MFIAGMPYLYYCSYYRIKTYLHSVAQTIAGAVLGMNMGYIAVFKEQEFLDHFLERIHQTRDYVPIQGRIGLIVIGVMILMIPEVIDTIKSKKNEKSS